MQIFIKTIANLSLTAFLIGCAHAPEAQNTKQPTASYNWHDGSRDGTYGIGEGWSIVILPPKYETVTERVVSNHPAGGVPLISIPAEYEWIEDASEDLSGGPVMVPSLITIPAEYDTITETLLLKAAKTEYTFSDARYNAHGVIVTPKHVNRVHTPAVTKQKERRVMIKPERTVEQMAPLERRVGYRRIIKKPAMTVEDTTPLPIHTETRQVLSQPWIFRIKNPQGNIAHSFDDFEDLTAFTDSLK